MGKVAETLGSGLITGPATIVSGIMQSRASNKATDAQSKSAAETLAFAREQEAQRKAVYDQKMAQYTAMRNTLARRYGIDIGSAPGAVPRAAMPGPEVASSAGMPTPGTTLGGLIQRKQPPPDLGSWNQNNYGLPTF